MRLSCGGDNSPAFRSLPLRALSSVGDTSDICSETLLSGNLQQTSGVRSPLPSASERLVGKPPSSLAWISRSSSQESDRVGSRRQPDARCSFHRTSLKCMNLGCRRGRSDPKNIQADQPVRNAPEKKGIAVGRCESTGRRSYKADGKTPLQGTTSRVEWLHDPGAASEVRNVRWRKSRCLRTIPGGQRSGCVEGHQGSWSWLPVSRAQ